MRRKIVRAVGTPATALLACGLIGLLAWGSSADARLAAAGDKTEPAEEAGEQPQGAAGDAQEAEEVAPADQAEPEAGGEAEAAGEPEWFTDEKGMTYQVLEVPKGREGAHYRWIDDKTVKIALGMKYEVIEETETTFKLKSYGKPSSAAEPPPPALKVPPEERRAKAAEAFQVDIETVDRLRLEPFDRGLPRRGQWRNGFDVADMNGDGELDIVSGPSRKAARLPAIFLGDGKGGWRLWKEARFPRAPYDYGDAAAADFNGDGHMDMALAIHLSGHLVLVGDGEGGFETWSEGIGLETPGKGGSASTYSSRAIEAVDWNGDGRTDLLALGEGPKGLPRPGDDGGELKTANGPILFLNGGDGTWSPRGYPSNVFGDALATGDFNADGKLDFANANHVVGSRTLLHLGEGTGWQPVQVDAVRPRGVVRAVAAGRLDGDDRDDIVVGYSATELGVQWTGIDVLHGAEDGSWRRQPLYAAEGRQGIYSVAVGDIDGNGRPDVAGATGHGEILVFLADESGVLARERSPELPGIAPGCRGFGLRLVDLDDDGRDELLVGFAGEVTGLPRFGGSPGCANGGSLRAWTALPKEAAKAASGES